LQTKIEKAQAAKKDATMGQTVRAKEAPPVATIRTPPQIKLRRTLKGHFGKVTAMHWGGDSTYLVSASQDGNILIWNAKTSNKLQSISLKSSYVMAVGMEQSRGNMIACGGLDNLCTVYRCDAPDRANEMASHDGFLSCCRFLSEQSILSSSGDSTCIRWDTDTGKPVETFSEHTADAMFLSLRPGDANVFASCSVDRTAKIWDIRAATKSVQTFCCHTDDINCVEFMPSDSNCFATCSQDNTARLFDMRACNELNYFTCPRSGPAAVNGSNAMSAAGDSEGLTSLTFSGSGRLLFCGHADGSVLAFDVLLNDKRNNNAVAFTLAAAHERHVSAVSVSPKGDALCTAGWDGQLKIWA
jgi:guanine nucleotide-binding protein G(I)/G(S)/G(T) subunit beta-1